MKFDVFIVFKYSEMLFTVIAAIIVNVLEQTTINDFGRKFELEQKKMKLDSMLRRRQLPFPVDNLRLTYYT